MTLLQIFSLDDEKESTIISTLSEGEHSIGRDKLNCKDKRISRNHAIITVTENEIVLKSTHVNPSFYKPCGGNSIKLVKTDETVIINDGDKFGLLADAFWFKTRVVESNNGVKRPYNRIEVEENKRVKISNDVDNSNCSMGKKNVHDEQIETVSNESEKSLDFADVLYIHNEQQNKILELDKPIVDNNKKHLEDMDNAVIKKDEHTSEETETHENNDLELDKSNDMLNKDEPPMNKAKQKCWYGAKCYRNNIYHKQEYSHPGDSDYDENSIPDCPFGSSCYRTNMLHRQQYKHTNPPAPKPASDVNSGRTSNQNNSVDDDSADDNTIEIKKRNVATKVKKYTETSEDEYDLEDPFINDGSSDDFELSDNDDSDSDWQDSQEVEEESQERKRLLKEAKKFIVKKKQK